ncbi:MAG: AMIN domain-containing protein [Desulforegulaceae bacterium]|nr:AMIN domain-containing protein [Desulforegulaceae bacterium]
MTKTKFPIFFLIFFFCFSANVFAEALSVVQNISFSKKNKYEKLTILIKHTPNPNIFILENPKRLVIDLHNSKIPQIITKKKVNGDKVKQIRTNQFKKNTSRIVLDLKNDADFDYKSTLDTKKHFSKLNVFILSKGQSFPLENTNIKTKDKEVETKELEKKSPTPPLKTESQISGFDFQEETEEIIFAFDNSAAEGIFSEVSSAEKKDFKISGIIKTKATRDTKKSRDKIKNKTSFRNKTIVEAKYKKTLTCSVLSDFLYFGDNENFNEYDFDIYELTYKYFGPKISFSLGKQIIRWGKTDQLSPVDTLNPEDMREFVTSDYEDRKIPLWMADLKLFSNFVNLEFLYIPFFKKSKHNNFETDWSRFPHLKKEVKQSSLPPPVKNYFNNLGISENEPENENEYGIRLFKTIKSLDFGFTWHKFNEDEPFISNFPIKNININGDFSVDKISSSISPADLTNEKIVMDYKKANAYGFEFETIISGFGLRGEALWQDKKTFLKSDLTSVRSPVFTYVLGADYLAPGNTYFNIQFGHQYLNDYVEEIIYADKNDYFLFGEISKDYPNYWTKIALEYFLYLNTSSKYFSPKIEYSYFKNIELSAGANLFYGNYKTGFGKHQDNSQLFLNVRYFF